MRSNIEFKTKVRVADLLARLRENRSLHADVVVEAREGYVKQARAALEKRLLALEHGSVVALSFRLSVPVDCTSTYDTAIAMLEMHSEDTVTLEADEFRCLVQDQWDWSREFWATNKVYSPTATATAEELGY